MNDLLEYAKSLGGQVVKSSDMNVWERHAMRESVAPCSRAEAVGSLTGETARAEGVTLSTCHIGPKVIYRKGASIFTVKTGQTRHFKGEEAQEEALEEQEGQEAIEVRKTEKRGKVTTFTHKSAQRCRRKIGEVKRECLPYFVTLTYPMEYSTDAKVFKGHLKAFLKRLLRKFPAVSGVWKLEPQERGAPHFHLLVWSVDQDDLSMFVPQAWYQVVGSDDENHLLWHKGKLGNGNKHCVQKIESLGGVNWYISKYMSKDVVGQTLDWGRWWGVFNWDNAPLGEEEERVIPLKLAQDIIRYQRRYARVKSRAYQSLTILCDASQWVNRLL